MYGTVPDKVHDSVRSEYMDEIQLSVIIPAYNAEKTVGRCLDSILRSVQQSSVEIVCVDDGSNDAT